MVKLGTIAIGSIVAGATGLGCLGDYPLGARWDGRADDDVSAGSPTMNDEASSGASARSAVGHPSFGTTVSLAEAPPPISGGTIGVDPDTNLVVVADPDRGHVQIVTVDARPVLQATVDVGRTSRPERLAFDDEKRVHVVLRGTGEVATFAMPSLTLLARRKVCAEPRGIAWDTRLRAVHVACATGELVTMPGEPTGAPTVRRVADDLRDVVVTGRGIRVSTFREAKVLDVVLEGATGVVTKELFPGAPSRNVAWRMVAARASAGASQEDDVVVAGQRPGGIVATAPEYYGVSGCTSDGPEPVLLSRRGLVPMPTAVLPVDVAISNSMVYVVAAANGHTPGAANVIAEYWPDDGSIGCSAGFGIRVEGQPTSVAILPDSVDDVVVFTREPAALHFVRNRLVRTSVKLSEESREDTGHAIFHANSGAGIACASCHPDGRDDGHAWASSDIGPRRTPSLLGTVAGTAPYHWDGAAADMRAVTDMTFGERMKGPALVDAQKDALGSWLGKLPRMATATPSDVAAVARGKAIFDGAGGCTSCHAGPLGTNNRSVDVGTGLLVQVPPLVGVASRAPYFHDGKAKTLAAVLAGHGNVGLTAPARLDVEAYLRTF